MLVCHTCGREVAHDECEIFCDIADSWLGSRFDPNKIPDDSRVECHKCCPPDNFVDDE